MKTLLAYLQLMRPANIVTAVADVSAGGTIVWISIFRDFSYDNFEFQQLLLLVLSTTGLYGGGVVLNDVADRKIDATERPERPLPSKRATITGATTLGILLLLIGVVCSSLLSFQSALIATGIVLLVLLYNFYGKHKQFFGPLNMGACRGANLLLGMSASLPVLDKYYGLACIPIIFIAAITMISRGEVVGGSKAAIRYAALMFAIVIATIIFIPFHYWSLKSNIPYVIGIAGLFSILVFQPLFKAHADPQPINIRKAVKAGVLSIIVMDAAIATAFAGWIPGLIILALLPVSLLLARIFAVT